MQAAALGYYTAHHTQSAGWTALVAAAEFAPTAVLSPIGGVLADRMPRKRILLTMNLFQGAIALVMALVMSRTEPGAPILAVYALANGCAFALGFPSSSALMPDLVPKAIIGDAVGLSSASWNLGRIIGPLLGTLVYQASSVAWVLGVNAASFGAVFIALTSIEVPPHQPSTARVWTALKEGFTFARSEIGVRTSLIGLLMNTLFVAPFIGLIPAMVEKEFGGGSSAVGWLITAQGLGAVVIGLTFGKLMERYGLHRVMAGALALGPLFMAGWAAAPNWQISLFPILACGGAYFAALSSFSTTANLRSPANLRGRVLSNNQVVLGTVYAISLNLVGQLGDRIGVRTALIGSAAIGLAVQGIITLLRPGMWRRVDAPLNPNAIPSQR